MPNLLEETIMRKLLNQSWLPLLCLIALVSFAPAAQAGDVDFACAGTGPIPCSGTVNTDGTDYWTSDTQVFNTTAEYPSTTAFTLAFDTNNVGQLNSITISDGTNTLYGTINGFTAASSGTQTAVTLDVLWTGLPTVVSTALGTPQGLSPFASIITVVVPDTGGTALTPKSVDILISPTPEPTTMILFGSGLLAGAGYLRRKRKK